MSWLEHCPGNLVCSFSPHSHALSSPAYLPEHVGHVDCSGWHCVVGLINGVMQHPWLLHPRPHAHTYFTPDSSMFSPFVWFLYELCSDLRPATVFLKLQPLQLSLTDTGKVCMAVYVSVCCMLQYKTCRRFHRTSAPRCLAHMSSP